MRIDERVAELWGAARAARWRLGTLVRVGRQKGVHRTVHLSGLRFALRELPRGTLGPAFLMRFLAANEPHRIALVRPGALSGGEDRYWSYGELSDQADRIAAGLARRGLGRGSAALLMLKNRAEFVLIQTALSRLGASAVSASWRSTVPELTYLAQHSGSRAIFADPEVLDVVRAARPALCQEGGGAVPAGNFIVAASEGPADFTSLRDLAVPDPGGAALPADDGEEAAVVMYTSGTTGKPKGAVRKFNRDSTAAVFAFLGETPLAIGDVHLAVCPLYHATAYGFIAFTYVLGGSVVVLPEFRPELVLEAIQRYRINTVALVPTMIQRIVDLGREKLAAYDLSSLRAIFSGGSQLPATLARDTLDALGDKLWNFYGATETGVVTLAGPADLRASPGTIGRLVPGNEIRLIDEHGRDCPRGQVGELWVRSPNLIAGYHHDAEATRGSMLEGYFSVGDLAREDARGCFHLEGRKRDMIISGGVNVYPAEVEGVLDAHPAVADAAVVGVPDRDLGERVRAFVVLRPELPCSDADLRAYCKAHLSGPKVPRDFVFMDALPRNPTGKVLKRELRTIEV